MSTVARLASLLPILLPAPSLAQDPGSSEVVVTGARRERDDFDATRPAVGLRRTADFAVIYVPYNIVVRPAN